MGPIGLMHQAVDRIGELPPLRHARRAKARRRFALQTDAHSFDGVFDSFEAALAHAPAARPRGYDNPASAGMYDNRLDIDEHDYPAMFWVARSLAEGALRVVDVGGSVGIKFFAFGRYMAYPVGLRWRVIEVPAVVARGRAFAQQRGAAGPQRAAPALLEFSDRLQDADAADVMLASGSLQYLPQSLGEILRGLSNRPRRIVVNTTPIHPHRSFFTLNNIGTAYCAYRVQAFDEFVGGVQACGYRLVHQWRNAGKALSLPFEPGCSVDRYSGFCFDRLA